MRYLSQWKSKDPHTNSKHRPSVSQRYHTGSIFAEKWVYDNDKNSKVFIKTFGSHFTLKNLIENIPKIQLCSTWFKTPLFSPPCHFIKSDESSPSTNHKCIYYFPKNWFSVHRTLRVHGNKAVQHKVLPSSLLSHYHHLPKLHCQPSLNDILAFCLKCIYIHPITRRKYAFKTFHYRPSLCWGYCSFPSSMSCYGDICLLDSFDYLSRII